jgi:hypothetical protein
MRFPLRAALFLVLVSPAAAALATGCGSSGKDYPLRGSGGSGGLGQGGATGSGAGSTGSGAGSTSSGTSSTGGSAPCVPVACNGHVYACGN